MKKRDKTGAMIRFLLSFFVGELGIDRFYDGRIGTGIAKLLTGGGLGIWWLIDVVCTGIEWGKSE